MDDWEHRIYQGLRHSKVMLAVLSPAYFQSDYCKKEWERFIDLEQQRRVPGEAIAPIYTATHPDFEPNVDELFEHWLKNLKRRQYVDARPWWQEGQAALQREDVRRKLQKLEQTMWKRIVHIRTASESPQTLPERVEFFAGRVEELRRLREQLAFSQINAVTAVNGIGGIGKSVLAFEYAHRYASEYPGGRFVVDCANAVDLRSNIVDLAIAHRNLLLSEEDRANIDVSFPRAKAIFEQGPRTLFILDNVDDPELVSQQSRSRSLPGGENVHVIITTRLEPRRLGGVKCLPLDSLAEADALELLFHYRPLPDEEKDEEWKAAQQIVHRLDGHALAVEVVAVHLGQHEEISYRAFLAGLDRKGIQVKLNQAGEDAADTGRISHPETLIGPLLTPTLENLSALERRTMEYASLLPPDHVPLPWLATLVAADVPNEVAHDDDEPDPWLNAVRRLEGLRLLTPDDERQLARVHRIVQAVISDGLDREERARLSAAITSHAVQRAKWLATNWGHAGRGWEIAPVMELASRLLTDEDRNGAMLSGLIARPLQGQGRFVECRRLLLTSLDLRERLARSLPDHLEVQRDWSISLEQMGDLSLRVGQSEEARSFFQQSLKIDERLARAFPDDLGLQRNWAVSLRRMGDMSLRSWQPEEACSFFQQALEINERLARSLPNNLEAQRDWSISLERMGDLSLASGRAEEASAFFADSLAITTRLAQALPNHVETQRDSSAVLLKLGNLTLQTGGPEEARSFLQQSMEIAERVARALPDDMGAQRHWSVSLNKMGDLSLESGQLDEARLFFQQSLEIIEQLARALPDEVETQRVWSVSLNKLGELSLQSGQPGEARSYFRQSLEIDERLARTLPEDYTAQRDVVVSCWKMRELYAAEDDVIQMQHWLDRALVTLRDMRQTFGKLLPDDEGILQQLEGMSS